MPKLTSTIGLFAALYLITVPLSNAEIYRYKDDNGRWHYSDTKPHNSNKEVQQVQQKHHNTIDLDINNFVAPAIPPDLCQADADRDSLYYKKRGGYLGKKGSFELQEKKTDENSRTLYALNNYFLPIELEINLSQSNNIKTQPALPLSITVPAQKKIKVAEISVNQAFKPWSYSYSHRYGLGDKNARHDSDCYYLAPVPPANDYLITQAFNGSFSHNSSYNRYAIDIAMPLGTPVLAARSGVVIHKQTEEVLNGLDESFKSRANSIAILHADGTIAVYAHLQFRSIRFREGMSVKTGQVIAKSGNTGYSTGPHLHFEVVSNQNLRWQSMPFKFIQEGEIITPQQGETVSNKALETQP